MGYVGNSPAEKYTTIDKQVITGNGTVGPYTLTHSVGNEQEIEVFVNNVRQEPGVAYTVSANQLTMGGTVAAADDFYIVFQGKAKMTATHPPTFDLNAANGTFTGDLTVDTNTLYVDSTNNRVGIGTSSPSVNFHVKNASGNLEIRFDSDNARNIVFADNNGTYDAQIEAQANGTLYIATRQAQPMLFAINNSEKMRIDSTGNVGIGTSNTTAGKTTINLTGVAVAGDTDGSTIGSSGIVNLYNSNQVTNSTVMLLGGGSDSTVGQIASGIGFTREDSGNWGTQLRFYTHTTATSDLDELKERMRIDSSGNVSIGTAATPEKLSIEAPLSTLAGLGLTYSGATKAVFSVLPSTGEVRIGGTAANYFPTFYSSGTEAMRIDSSGNLLVGQSTTALPGLGNTTTGISLAGNHDIIAASRTSGASVLVNRNTDDGSLIEFSRNGTTVGDIGVNNGDNLRIQGNSSHSGIEFGTNAIFPHKNSSNVDATIDLGESSLRWKDLHLSGGVVFGATGGAVTSKTLDDYEEGVWYPVLKASTTNPTYTANNTVGYYVKIGNMVYVTWYSSVLNITNSGAGGAQIGNLPFTAASGSQEYWLFNYQHGTGLAGTNTSGGYVERNNNNLIFVQQGTVLNSTWVQLNGRYVMISAAYRTA